MNASFLELLREEMGRCYVDMVRIERGMVLLPRAFLPELAGRIHFAGEHASLHHAWIQGAIESGLRAASEINAFQRHSSGLPKAYTSTVRLPDMGGGGSDSVGASEGSESAVRRTRIPQKRPSSARTGGVRWPYAREQPPCEGRVEPQISGEPS